MHMSGHRPWPGLGPYFGGSRPFSEIISQNISPDSYHFFLNCLPSVKLPYYRYIGIVLFVTKLPNFFVLFTIFLKISYSGNVGSQTNTGNAVG